MPICDFCTHTASLSTVPGLVRLVDATRKTRFRRGHFVCHSCVSEAFTKWNSYRTNPHGISRCDECTADIECPYKKNNGSSTLCLFCYVKQLEEMKGLDSHSWCICCACYIKGPTITSIGNVTECTRLVIPKFTGTVIQGDTVCESCVVKFNNLKKKELEQQARMPVAKLAVSCLLCRNTKEIIKTTNERELAGLLIPANSNICWSCVEKGVRTSYAAFDIAASPYRGVPYITSEPSRAVLPLAPSALLPPVPLRRSPSPVASVPGAPPVVEVLAVPPAASTSSLVLPSVVARRIVIDDEIEDRNSSLVLSSEDQPVQGRKRQCVSAGPPEVSVDEAAEQQETIDEESTPEEEEEEEAEAEAEEEAEEEDDIPLPTASVSADSSDNVELPHKPSTSNRPIVACIVCDRGFHQRGHNACVINGLKYSNTMPICSSCYAERTECKTCAHLDNTFVVRVARTIRQIDVYPSEVICQRCNNYQRSRDRRDIRRAAIGIVQG